METNIQIKKCLVVIFILILISVAFTSSIDANNQRSCLENEFMIGTEKTNEEIKEQRQLDYEEDFDCLIFGWTTNTFFSIDGTMIAFGFERLWHEGGSYDHPAKGRVFSYGKNGLKQWSGTFYGQISATMIWGPLFAERLFTGVKGFSGATIKGAFYSRFIGHADHISLGDEHD